MSFCNLPGPGGKKRPILDINSHNLIYLWNVPDNISVMDIKAKAREYGYGHVQFVETFEAWKKRRIGQIIIQFADKISLDKFAKALTEKKILAFGPTIEFRVYDQQLGQKAFFHAVRERSDVDLLTCRAVPASFDYSKHNHKPPTNTPSHPPANSSLRSSAPPFIPASLRPHPPLINGSSKTVYMQPSFAQNPHPIITGSSGFGRRGGREGASGPPAYYPTKARNDSWEQKEVGREQNGGSAFNKYNESVQDENNRPAESGVGMGRGNGHQDKQPNSFPNGGFGRGRGGGMGNNHLGRRFDHHGERHATNAFIHKTASDACREQEANSDNWTHHPEQGMDSSKHKEESGGGDHLAGKEEEETELELDEAFSASKTSDENAKGEGTANLDNNKPSPADPIATKQQMAAARKESPQFREYRQPKTANSRSSDDEEEADQNGQKSTLLFRDLKIGYNFEKILENLQNCGEVIKHERISSTSAYFKFMEPMDAEMACLNMADTALLGRNAKMELI